MGKPEAVQSKKVYIESCFLYLHPNLQNHKHIFRDVLTTQCQRNINTGKILQKRSFCSMQRLLTLFFLPLKSLKHDWVCILRHQPFPLLQSCNVVTKKRKNIEAIFLREHTFFILAQITSKSLLFKLRICAIVHAVVLVQSDLIPHPSSPFLQVDACLHSVSLLPTTEHQHHLSVWLLRFPEKLGQKAQWCGGVKTLYTHGSRVNEH